MVLIYDDTFSLRSGDQGVAFINEQKYKAFVRVIGNLIDGGIENETEQICTAKVVACHKTIKFKNERTKGYLPPEANSKVFEKFEKAIRGAEVIYISFSGQITQTKLFSERYIAMNKADFYSNLKDFLDVYLIEQQYIPKVLKFGKHYRGNELLSIQNNVQYICDQFPMLQTLSELIKRDKRTLEELNKYNSTAAIRIQDSDWLDLLCNKYNDKKELQNLLNKITKSFMKYGKCIYHI